MCFDLPARALELQHLSIRERLPVLPLQLNLPFFRAALFYRIDGQLLDGDFLIDHLAVTHFI
jgi:hypothetical protein